MDQVQKSNPFIQAIEEIDKELLLRECRTNYYKYTQYTNKDFKKTRFHEFLCKEVQNFIEASTNNAYDILLLSVPPQHGKSLAITETLPSWYLGKNPTKSVIVAGYSGDFVKRFGRRNLSKLEEYGPEIFPDIGLAMNPCNTSEFELSNHLGRALFAGIIGGITGNPANLFIIDDPIKNREEAYSETTRAKQKEEYLCSIKSRFAAGTKIIVIQTRWHEDDLFGWLARTEQHVSIINIPCECVDPKHDLLHRKMGEALMPEIGKGASWLKDFKKSYMEGDEGGPTAWNALYQGNPTAASGNMFKRDWWRYYTPAQLPELPLKVISVDAAFKDGLKNDFVAIEVWGKSGENYYLLDLIKKRLNFVDTIEAIRAMRTKYPDTEFVYIEDKANGSAIIEILSAEMDGIIPIQPEGGKIARANAVTPAIESGRVYLPRFSGFVTDFLDECAAFPTGAHDDQVDAMSQALNRLTHIDADVISTKNIKYVEWSEDMKEDYEQANLILQEEMVKMWGYPMEMKDE